MPKRPPSPSKSADGAQPKHTPEKKPKKSPSKSQTSTSGSKERETWTPEKRNVSAEMILEAGYGALDFDMLSSKTGLSKQQLRDGLKYRQNKTNLRMQMINFAGAGANADKGGK